MKTRNIREVKKKTKYEDSIDGIVWNLVGRVNVLEDKVNVLDKGTMNPERLDGVDDSEEVEEEKLTMGEIIAIGEIIHIYVREHNMNKGNFDFRFGNILVKLNKMLKEKE